MSDMLSIGSSGVTAYQRALATVSNNIANVSTDGYSRQDVSVSANQPQELGGGYIGTGARFDQVRRQFDAFVESNLRNSNSDLKAQEPLLSYVNRLIDVMGDQSIGLTTAMNQFFESASTLASDPASSVARNTFLRDADGLASRYRQLASQFELLDNETRQSVQTDVGQINSLTQQLGQINKQLSKKSDVNDQPSELLDQRDLLLRQLSGLIAVKTRFAENGSVVVSVGDTIDQGILVRDSRSRDIEVSTSSTDPTKLQFQIDPYGKPEGLPQIVSGKIGGVMAFRDQVLAPAVNALDNLAKNAVQSINAIHRDGIDAEGQMGSDLFGFTAGKEGTAAGMQLLVQDITRIAAAGQFRVIDQPLNSGSANARVTYSSPQYAGADLSNNLAPVPMLANATIAMPPSQGFASVGLIQAGTKDAVLTLNTPGANRSLQVYTRDGRHLLGTSLTGSAAGSAIQDRITKAANGMEAGAQASDALLNASGDARYLDMDLFMGVKADVQYLQQFSSAGKLLDPMAAPALMQGRVTTAANLASLSGRTQVFTLNGQTLSGLPAGATPSDLANWINHQSPAIAGVTASVSADGALQLVASNTSMDIRLGLGSQGTSADLAALGFDTSVYISGQAQDDLLVFATDTSGADKLADVSVSGQYQSLSGDIKQTLRAQSLEVEFTSDSSYVIRDTKTNTLLAERSFDKSTNPTIDYRGLQLSFTANPHSGDIFNIDGNQDGIGNNEAMLRLVNLESSKVMPNGQTLTEAYIDRVNQVGSVARQASISEQALKVVYQQAQQARDGVSGVSLDEEASQLVRFQQAYQANAKVMQVASQLFDSILQVQ
jgi:flagellar hook-associated protein FlgK